jgi:glucosamine-6-phosphate deaminase
MVASKRFLERYPILVKIFDNADQVGKAAADRIGDLVFHDRNRGRDTVLGVGSGDSLRPLYEALSRYREKNKFSFSTCHTFALDEYYPMSPFDKQGLSRQITTSISALNVHSKNRHVFWGDLPESEVDAHCRDYEQLIAKQNGIDFQLLGIGRNGHIGFNEPGSLFSDRTRLVHLTEETRLDAVSHFESLQQVPHRALTMGIDTILDASEICLIVLGAHKARIVKQVIDSTPNPALPASYLKTHPHVTVYLDRTAARLLPLTGDVTVIQ